MGKMTRTSSVIIAMDQSGYDGMNAQFTIALITATVMTSTPARMAPEKSPNPTRGHGADDQVDPASGGVVDGDHEAVVADPVVAGSCVHFTR